MNKESFCTPPHATPSPPGWRATLIPIVIAGGLAVVGGTASLALLYPLVNYYFCVAAAAAAGVAIGVLGLAIGVLILLRSSSSQIVAA